MPVASLIEPEDFTSGEFTSLALKINEGIELLKFNKVANGEFSVIDETGDPEGVRINMPQPKKGISVYFSKPGNVPGAVAGTPESRPPSPLTLSKQNTAPLPPDRKGYLLDRQLVGGHRPMTDLTHASKIAGPGQPKPVALEKGQLGYSAGIRYYAVTWVDALGRHTDLSDVVLTPNLANRETLVAAIPSDRPLGAVGMGLWLSLPVPLGQTPDASTLRLQRVVSFDQHKSPTYDLNGPYRDGADAKRPPQRNETFLGRVEPPIVRRDDAPGNLMPGKWQFAISLVTAAGEAPISAWSRHLDTEEFVVTVENAAGQVIREISGPVPNKAYYIRPAAKYHDLEGFRVWARERDTDKTYVVYNRAAPGGPASVNPMFAREHIRRANKRKTGRFKVVEKEVLFYGITEESPELFNWRMAESELPLEDASGIERPGAPEAPYKNPLAAALPVAGDYLVGLAYSDGERETPIGPLGKITITSAQMIYVPFPDPVNLVPNPENSEVGAPVTDTADTPPLGWRVLNPTLGGKFTTVGGRIVFESAAQATTKSLEWVNAEEIPDDREMWFLGRAEVDQSAGTYEVSVVQYETNAAGALVELARNNATDLLVSAAADGIYDIETHFGASTTAGRVQWQPSATHFRMRISWSGATRTGTAKVSNLAAVPMENRPRRFERAAAGSRTPDDTSPGPQTPYPSEAAKCIALPPAAPSFAPPPVLARLNLAAMPTGSRPAQTGWSFIANANNVAQPETNLSVISKVGEQYALPGETKGWRVEDATSGLQVHIGGSWTAPDHATRTTLGNHFPFRVAGLPTSYDIIVGMIYSATSVAGSPAMVQLKLNGYGQLELLALHRGATTLKRGIFLSGIKAGDVLDVELVATNGNTANGTVTCFVGKNGAARTPQGFLTGMNWTGLRPGVAYVGNFLETNPSARYALDYGTPTVTNLGDEIASSVAATGRPLPNPDRPLRDALTHAAYDWSAGLSPAGWEHEAGVGGISEIVTRAGYTGQAWRMSGTTQRSLARTFSAVRADTFGVEVGVNFRAFPAARVYLLRARSGNSNLAAVYAEGGQLWLESGTASGTAPAPLAIASFTADASVRHTVELQLSGIGSSGAVSAWYRRQTAGVEDLPKRVYRQHSGMDWTGLSAGRVLAGALSPAGAYDHEISGLRATEEGSTLFDDTFQPASPASVTETLGFEDPTAPFPVEWTVAGGGVVSEFAGIFGDRGLRVSTAGAAAFSATRPLDPVGDLEGVRETVRFQTLPAVALTLLEARDAAGTLLGHLEKNAAGAIEVVSADGRRAVVVPAVLQSEEWTLEILVLGVGTNRGVIRGIARRNGAGYSWVAQLGSDDAANPRFNWSGRKIGSVSSVARCASGPLDLHVDAVEVLRREIAPPQNVVQVHLFFPKGSPVRDDVGLEVEPLGVVPGLPFRIGAQMRWEGVVSSDPSYAAHPVTAFVMNSQGGTIDISHLFPPVSGTSAWTDYQMTEAFTPPAGYHELRIESRRMGAGTFVIQRLAASEGVVVRREQGYAEYGRLRAQVDTGTPKADIIRNSSRSTWVSLDDGVARQPEGTVVLAQYSTADGDVPFGWTPYITDPQKVVPKKWCEFRFEVFGDGATSPLIAVAGPKVEYRKPFGTLTDENRVELPGGVIIKGVQDPTLAPDFVGEWTEGGHLYVQAATPPLGRLEPYIVYTFTDEGARWLNEKAAGAIVHAEYRGKLVRHKFPSNLAVKLKTELGPVEDEDGTIYHVWGEGSSPLSEVVEEGKLAPGIFS